MGATDGFRVHYTPEFRPFSSVNKRIINVAGINTPDELTIPPESPRFFISRTCKVDTNCKDADERTLNIVSSILARRDEAAAGLRGASCESLQFLCGVGGTIGAGIQRLCPSTCGLCEKGTD